MFLDGVRDLLGVEPEVLTGQAEAAAATAAPPPASTATSPPWSSTSSRSTELILGDGTTSRAMVSLDIGCVRLFERHLHGDPPTAAEVAALQADVAAHLAGVAGVLDPAAALGSSGSRARSPP